MGENDFAGEGVGKGVVKGGAVIPGIFDFCLLLFFCFLSCTKNKYNARPATSEEPGAERRARSEVRAECE